MSDLTDEEFDQLYGPNAKPTPSAPPRVSETGELTDGEFDQTYGPKAESGGLGQPDWKDLDPKQKQKYLYGNAAPFVEMVGKSWKEGEEGVARGITGLKVMNGQAVYEKTLQAPEAGVSQAPPSNQVSSWDWQNWVGDAVKTLPFMRETFLGSVKGGVAGAGLGAGGAAVLGAAGPQVGLPEEVVTVPTAAAFGYRWGSRIGAFTTSSKIMAGQLYLDLRDKGIDDRTAKVAGVAGGAVQGLIEAAQLELLGGAARQAFVAQLGTRAGKNALLGFVTKYIQDVGVEVTEEEAQTITGLLAQGIAAYVDKNPNAAPKADEIKEMLLQTFEQTLRSSVLLVGGSKAAGTLTGATTKAGYGVVESISSQLLRQQHLAEATQITEGVKRGTEVATGLMQKLAEGKITVEKVMGLVKEGLDKGRPTEEQKREIAQIPVKDILDALTEPKTDTDQRPLEASISVTQNLVQGIQENQEEKTPEQQLAEAQSDLGTAEQDYATMEATVGGYGVDLNEATRTSNVSESTITDNENGTQKTQFKFSVSREGSQGGNKDVDLKFNTLEEAQKAKEEIDNAIEQKYSLRQKRRIVEILTRRAAESNAETVEPPPLPDTNLPTVEMQGRARQVDSDIRAIDKQIEETQNLIDQRDYPGRQAAVQQAQVVYDEARARAERLEKKFQGKDAKGNDTQAVLDKLEEAYEQEKNALKALKKAQKDLATVNPKQRIPAFLTNRLAKLQSQRETLETERALLSEGLLSPGEIKKSQVKMTAGQVQNLRAKAVAKILKAFKQGHAQGVKFTRAEIKELQNEVISLLKNSGLSLKDQGKFLRRIKNIQTQSQFARELPKIQSRVNQLLEIEARKAVLGRLNKLLKAARLAKSGKRGISKFRGEGVLKGVPIQKVLDTYRKALTDPKWREAQARKISAKLSEYVSRVASSLEDSNALEKSPTDFESQWGTKQQFIEDNRGPGKPGLTVDKRGERNPRLNEIYRDEILRSYGIFREDFKTLKGYYQAILSHYTKYVDLGPITLLVAPTLKDLQGIFGETEQAQRYYTATKRTYGTQFTLPDGQMILTIGYEGADYDVGALEFTVRHELEHAFDEKFKRPHHGHKLGAQHFHTYSSDDFAGSMLYEELQGKYNQGSPIVALQDTLNNLIAARLLGFEEKSVEEQNRIADEIEDLIQTGKIAALDRKLEEAENRAKAVGAALESIQGNKPLDTLRPENSALSLDTGAAQFKRLLKTLNRTRSSWDGLMSILSQNDPKQLLKQVAEVYSVIRNEVDTQRQYREKLIDTLISAVGKNKKAVLDRVVSGSKKQEIGQYTDQDGETVKLYLSRNEAIKLWNQMSDPDLEDGLVAGNLYTFDGDVSQGQTSTRALLDKFLTADDKKIAEGLKQFYREYFDRVNREWEDETGASLERNEEYSGYALRRGTPQTTTEAFYHEQFSRSSIKPSSTISRVANARGLELSDAFVDALKHVQDFEHWINWRQREKILRGIFANPEIRSAVKLKYGDGMMRTVDDRFNDMVGTRQEQQADALKFLDNIRTNAGSAFVGGKALTFFQQLSAVLNFMVYVDPIQMADGLIDFALHPKRAIETMEQSPLLRNRVETFDRDLMEALTSDDIKSLKTRPKLLDMTLWFTKYGDRVSVWTGGWAVYKAELKKTGDPQKAMLAFEKAFQTTQQSGTPDQLSQIERSGPFGKIMTLFLKQQLQMIELEVEGIRKVFNHPSPANLVDAARRVAVIHASSALFQAIGSAFIYATGDDDDKEGENIKILRALILGPLNGIPLLGDVLTAGATHITNWTFDKKERVWKPKFLPYDAAGKLYDLFKHTWEAIEDKEEDGITLEEFLQLMGDYNRSLDIFFPKVIATPLGNIPTGAGIPKEPLVKFLKWLFVEDQPKGKK